MGFSAELTKQHFKVSIYRGILSYIEKNFPEVDTDELCREAGLTRAYLENPSNWVSIAFAIKFTQLCKERTNDLRISFNSGSQRMSPSTIGESLFEYFSGQVPVKTLYRILPMLTSTFSKVTRVEVVNLNSNSAVIELSLRREAFDDDEDIEICRKHAVEIFESTIGYYAAIPTMHGLPVAVVDGNLDEGADRLPRYIVQINFADIGFKFPFMNGAIIILSAMMGWAIGVFTGAAWWALIVAGASVGFGLSSWLRQRSTMEALIRGSEAMTHHARQYNIIHRRKAAEDRFVPIELLKLVGRDDFEDLKIGDVSECELTALFCDVNNFTAASADLGPRGTQKLLNEIFAEVCPEIRRHRGREVAFIFDEVVAVFQDNPADAINAGCSILQGLERFNGNRILSGAAPVAVKIGINTGKMCVGVNGYKDQMTLSFASFEGSIGKRLQQLGKELGVSLLVGRSAIDGAESQLQYPFRMIGRLPLKGVREKAEVFQVLPTNVSSEVGPFTASKEVFRAAIEAFGQGDFGKALSLFEDVLRQYPADKVAVLYRAQCTNALKGITQPTASVTETHDSRKDSR